MNLRTLILVVHNDFTSVNSMDVEFWFCLGSSYLVTPRGVRGIPPPQKLGALKLHLQHSENSFGEIKQIKIKFYWCIF